MYNAQCTYLPLEIQDTYGHLTLGVVTGGGKCAAVCQHGRLRNHYPLDGAIFVRTVLAWKLNTAFELEQVERNLSERDLVWLFI